MKIFMTLLLASYSTFSFATCVLKAHKTTSNKTINALIDAQLSNEEFKSIKLNNFFKNPDFGIKEEKFSLVTGEKDIFNEDITIDHSSLKLYENGKVIFETVVSSDYNKITKEVLTKILSLNCK